MPLQFAHGAIQWLSTDVATTVYTVSGLPFQPKALRFYWVGEGPFGAGVDHATEGMNCRRGVGFATSTSDRRCVTTLDRDAQGSVVTADAYSAAAVAITAVHPGPSVDAALDLNSITSDGFTLIVDDQQSAATITVFWEAWGGTDITVAVTGTISEPVTTGDQDYTVTGFDATGADQVVMFAAINSFNTSSVLDDSCLCVGFASGPAVANNITLVGSNDLNSADSDTDGYCKTGECLALIVNGGGNPDYRATLTQWNTDGFRLNWIAAANLARGCIFLAIKGGRWNAGATTIAGNSASATVTVSGLPYQQQGVCLMGRVSAEQSAGVSAAEDRICLGTATSTSSRRAMGCWSEDAKAAIEINLAVEYDQCLITPSAAGAADHALDISAWNTDGFTLIVDTVGIGVASEWVGYLTFGSEPVKKQNLFHNQSVYRASSF